jgi:hypothetical protein
MLDVRAIGSSEEIMPLLHIENAVEDYDAWKTAFDKFERLRTDNGVLSYRISRPAGDPHRVYVDLEFTTHDEASAFIPVLEKIWQTPQARAVSSSHSAPEIRDVDEQRTLAGDS